MTLAAATAQHLRQRRDRERERPLRPRCGRRHEQRGRQQQRARTDCDLAARKATVAAWRLLPSSEAHEALSDGTLGCYAIQQKLTAPECRGEEKKKSYIIRGAQCV